MTHRDQLNDELCRWFGRGIGQRLLEDEKRQLDGVLATLFGYHLLQIGSTEPMYEGSRILHPILMGWDKGRSGLHAEAERLPLAAESLDVVLLHHVLEFSSQPHEILREVERCLIPEGHVVICGFNPRSLWGVWRVLLGWRQQHPWQGRFYSASRIKDWLALLGCDLVSCETVMYHPPFSTRGVVSLPLLERLGQRLFPQLGAAFILVAKKRVSTLTPIRPRWRPRRLLGVGLSKT